VIAAEWATDSTAATAVGTLVVTVQRPSGTGIGGAMVYLVGTSYRSVADVNGKATLVARGGDYRLIVRFIGCPPASQDVTITEDASVATTVTVPCDAHDAVSDVASPTSPHIWLLDHGSDDSGPSECKNDILVQGAGLQLLTGNATPTDASSTNCHLAGLVLSPDRAPFYANTPADFIWTAGLGETYSPTLPGGKLRVPIRIIISDPTLTSKTALKNGIANAELALLKLALDDSYAGIELVDEGGGAPQITVDDVSATVTLLKGGCANAAAIRARPSIYSQGRLNVYYVRDVMNEEGGGAAGYVCGNSDAPNIIFVDHDGHFTSVLAHEVGHALGLTTPFWGHADFFEGFYEDAGRKMNVMVDGLSDPDETLPADARYFSVGQVARMHLGDRSWLNWPSAISLSTLRAREAMPASGTIVPCGCPETEATDDCAATNRDIDRTATATKQGASGINMACSVVATNLHVDICVGSTAREEAKFYSAMPNAQASTMWVSMNPTVVNALSAPAPYGDIIMNGDLKGLIVGNATVRAYADGWFATMTVTVKPPC